MVPSEKHTTIPPSMTLKNRSNGDFQTSMVFTSMRRQVTMMSGADPTHLDSLLLQELGWAQSKVEELLLPIIQKIRKRSQVGPFFGFFTCMWW